jgi:hypothetical protein
MLFNRYFHAFVPHCEQENWEQISGQTIIAEPTAPTAIVECNRKSRRVSPCAAAA